MLLTLYTLFFVITLVFLFGCKHSQETATGLLSRDNTTVMRGIAILMVVVHHLSLWFGTNVLTPFGGCGVAIFLILSGFGLTMSYQKSGVKKFWWKRFVGVFVPWLLFTLLTMQPWKLFRQEWFWEYLFFIDYGPWYMQYLFVWYLLFFLAHCNRWIYQWRWIIVGIAAALMFFLWEPLQQEQSLCFPLGMWMGEHYELVKKVDKKKYLRWSVTAAIVAVAALGAKQIPYIRSDINSWTFITLQVILKTSMAIAVMAAVPFIRRIGTNRFLSFTGVISYEMYLAHGYIYEHLLPLTGGEHSFLFIVIFFPVMYLLCYLLYRLDDGTDRMLNFIRNRKTQ